MIELAIRQILLSDPDVSAMVGERITVGQQPQTSADPAIVFFIGTERAIDALDGPLGMDQPKFWVVCQAATPTGASQLRRNVRKALAGFSGVVSGYYIKGVAQVDQRGQTQTSDRVRVGTDQYRYINTQQFRVTYDWATV